MTHSTTFRVADENRFDVVIAGAGFAGLALAAALADAWRGAASRPQIALVARDAFASGMAPPRADSRATALSAASVRMLDRLGVWPLCRDAAQPVTKIDITDSGLGAGIRPVLLSYDNLLGEGDAASHIIPNAALEAAIASVVAQAPSITVLDQTTITGFEAGIDHTSVRLAAIGSPAPARTITTRLLVAADGGRSPLRTMAGIKTVGWSYPQTGLTVTVAHERPHEGCAVQHFLPGGPFAMLPLPGNRSCITWSEKAEVASVLATLNDAAFLLELDRRAAGRLGELRLDGPRQSWPLNMFIARAFAAPRFALVGDAAHTIHPIAGQGLNLGLRDVAALAEVVVETHRLGLDIGQPATLERYERWRRFDTVSSAASFDMLNRLFSTEGTLRRSLREVGLGLVDRMPGLKRRLVAEAAGTAGTLPRLLRGEAI